MADGALCVRHPTVYSENGNVQDNVPNAIETRDIDIEARIETDNVHIHTEIYSTTRIDVPPDANYEHCVILHCSRSKNVVTEDHDISESTPSRKRSFSSTESKQTQDSKIEPVDLPSEEPQKDSWDEGSRIRLEAKKYFETKEPLCHPDCSELYISRSTQLELGDEIEITFEECVMSTITRVDKGSMCLKNVEDDKSDLATIPEEGSLSSTRVSEPSISASMVSNATQSTEDGQAITTEQEDYENDENVYITDDEYVSDAQDDTEFADTERLMPDEGEEETAVETDSIYETDTQEKQKKLKEPSQWTSGAWIKSPSPTRLAEAETRSCARLIRSFSSQLNRGERCETQCAPYTNIPCATSSNRLCNVESSRRSRAEQFCSTDYCPPKRNLAFGMLQGPPMCDQVARYRSDRYGACNQYHSNFNKAYRESNDGWCPNDHASHVAHASQYAARTSMTYYMPAYYTSCNAWY